MKRAGATATACAGLVVLALLAAGCSGGGSSQPTASPDPGVRRLWQAAGLVHPLMIDGAVVGSSSDGHRSVINAVSLLSGRPRWSFRVPTAQPIVMGSLATHGVVVAEVGHLAHTRIGNEIPRDFIVLDAHDGRRLWTAPIGGTWGVPPFAISGDMLVTGDRSGTVTARALRTGTVRWRRLRPASCPQVGDQQYDEGLTADGAVLVASYQCQPDGYRSTLVERLTASTGTPQWQWATPRISVAETVWLTVQGAAESGNVVVVGGEVPPDAARFAATLAHAKMWPIALGTAQNTVLLALDARSGRLRWTEAGAQSEQVSFADRAVCESVSTGFECRDDETGTPTRPDVSLPVSAASPYGGDGSAGIRGAVAAVASAGPEADRISVSLMPVRGNGAGTTVRTDVRATVSNGSSSTSGAVVVGSGPLPGGATLVLLRRLDVTGYPLLALSVAPPRSG